MNCPNCQNPIGDGKLICEKCGAELEIISDVNMELEMHNTIKGIAKEQFTDNSEYSDIEFDDEDPSIIGLILKTGSKIGKLFYVVIAVLVIAVLFIAIRMGIKISHESSVEYQIEMADKAKDDNNLSQAIYYLEKACKLTSDNADYYFTISDYYIELGKYDDAVFTLTEVAENSEYDDVKRVQAYKKLFALLKDNGDYVGISNTLGRCNLDVVLKDYSSYIIDAPVFSVEAGTYTEPMSLVISSEGEGTIYYTTDKSDPVDYGIEYDGPIALEYGSYTIKAVVINDYSVRSETVSKEYLIDVAFSFSPTVEPASGDFEHAFFIDVNVPVMYTCYYTIDGEIPTKESNKYINPIPAQEGEHEYKFVVYANDGTPSEVVTRTYNVVLNTSITAADAVTALNQGLIDRGYLDESGCRKEGVDGKFIFMYSTIYPIEEMGDFYFVVEYLQDDFGNNKMTGNYYAIDCYNGVLYSVNIDGENGYTLSPL